MKAQDCAAVGSRVGHEHYKGAYGKGRTVAPITQRPDGVDVVVVEFDNGQLQKLEVRTLLTEAQVDEQLAHLKAEKTRIEKDFKRVSAEVKVKLNTAASLVREAQALASTIHREASNCGDASDDFQSALDDSGWYHSSAQC